MTLAAGTNLAHYEISSQLGKGGMGEVYQAKDQKLGRDVAIKVLPAEFAKDTDRVARFQREAKLLASLNHPNIAAIHGLEESDGTHFLVLELIDGDTLADRLKRGAIPVEESLKLALQIAEALEAAHEKGVIHRDLKPANIKVTTDGKVKVLDFGLAKAFAEDQGDMNLSNSPTLSAAATQQGVILGTAAYMSPEQAKGKSVDRQTDVWAFGAVLYEMLTGQAAFQGDDVTEILASVVKASVNLDALPANIHFRIREILTRCLQKEKKRRYSRIADVQYEIGQVLADPSGLFGQPVVGAKPRRKVRFGISWVITALVLGLIIAGMAVWYLKPTELRQITKFNYELQNDQQFGELDERIFAISPDGRQLVYATENGLYLRSMDALNSRLVSGTEGIPRKPFFSPDGQWIGYTSEGYGELKKIPTNGGAPVTLTASESRGFFSWGLDDAIVYADGATKIMKVSANGGIPEVLAEEEAGGCIAAQILPDGKTVMYTLGPRPYTIVVQSIESGERKELFPGDTARYIPTGHIVYAVDNNLFAVPFDLDRLEVTDGPTPMQEGIARAGGAPQYDISDSGTLVYIPSSGDQGVEERTLVWVDIKGEEEPLTEIPGTYLDLNLSPDGTRVAMAYTTERGNIDTWVWGLVRNTRTKLTLADGPDRHPIWTPDSQRIVYFSGGTETRGIYIKTADGTGKAEQLISEPESVIFPYSWADEGKILLFHEFQPRAQQSDIGMLSMEGGKDRELLLHNEEYSEANPKVSPDGRWLAYQSNESGQDEVYVRPFPDFESMRWPVSNNGGNSPLWSPDGRTLYYRNGDAVVSVTVETDPTFKPGNPEILFRGPFHSYQNFGMRFTVWDISPDGKRFITGRWPDQIVDESTAGIPRKINVVLNWFEELKKRAPAE